MSIVIQEEWRGSRGGRYYYVREGVILKRIDKYAISKNEVYKSRRGPTYEYLVPVQSIRGKEIYEFRFTNNGYLLFHKCSVEAFLRSKYPGIPDHTLLQTVRSEELMNLEFEIEDPKLLKFVRNIKEFYTSIVNEIKSYSSVMDFKIFFPGHAETTSTFLGSVDEGIIRCMVLQSDQARMRCLGKLVSWIYQLWVIVLISKALMVEGFLKHEHRTKPTWWIEQGKPSPAFVARSRNNNYYTFFFEPQIHEMVHLAGAFTKTRIHVRPDIIVARGNYSSLNDIAEADLLVECKVAPQEMREKKILQQMKDYVENYKPKTNVLVSPYNIDPLLKRDLEHIGVIVVEGVRPGSPGLEEFKRIVQRALTS
ncbi:MAG: hypothetical protein QXI64_09620 [Sulfolobales archaeon]